MKRSVVAETEENDSNTETESLLKNSVRKMADPETETSSIVSVTSVEVARQVKAVTDPLTQHLAHLCQWMQKLRNEQANRRHEETASSFVRVKRFE